MGSTGPFEWNGLPTVKWPPGRSRLVAVLGDSASKDQVALDLLVDPLDLAVRLRVADPGQDMPYA